MVGRIVLQFIYMQSTTRRVYVYFIANIKRYHSKEQHSTSSLVKISILLSICIRFICINH